MVMTSFSKNNLRKNQKIWKVTKLLNKLRKVRFKMPFSKLSLILIYSGSKFKIFRKLMCRPLMHKFKKTYNGPILILSWTYTNKTWIDQRKNNRDTVIITTKSFQIKKKMQLTCKRQ